MVFTVDPVVFNLALALVKAVGGLLHVVESVLHVRADVLDDERFEGLLLDERVGESVEASGALRLVVQLRVARVELNVLHPDLVHEEDPLTHLEVLQVE